MLHLWSVGIGSKWSTGAVWEHENVASLLAVPEPRESGDVVGLFFYGVPSRVPDGHRALGVADVLTDFRVHE